MSDAPKIDGSSEGGVTVPCPRCGRPLGPFVTDCPDCAASVGRTKNDMPRSPHKYSITLGEVMLIVVVVAVVLGVARFQPEAAMVVAVVLTIALIRTLGALHRARVWKIPISAWDVTTLVATSLGVAGLIVTSAAIAFFATCFPTGLLTFSLLIGGGLALAVIFGLAAAAFVAWKIRKLVWMAGTPPSLQGIRFLDDTPAGPQAIEYLDAPEEVPPPPPPPENPPEPPR